MTKQNGRNQSSLTDSLLTTLYIRAMETQRPDALLNDERAVALVTRMGSELGRIRAARVDEPTRTALVLRSREFDRCTREFLTRYPEAVAVHIGCGLDTRFERVDNGQVAWYDLDLPEVIDLRRTLIGGEAARYHVLACSVFDSAWLDTVRTSRQQPILFVAEGVLMFFEEHQVKTLILTLRDHFPDAELMFDAFSPFFVWANNRRVARTKTGAQCYWGLRRGSDVEQWADGIRLLAEWYPFCQPEPRLAHLRWVRFVPFLARVIGVYRYRLGQTGHTHAAPPTPAVRYG